jgi:carboxypeptidase PM20D1
VSRPVAFVGVAEKGYLTLRISADAERIRRVSGEDLAGHSSMPPRQSVVGIISAAVEQIESNPFPARLVAPTRYLIDYLGPELPLGQRLALSNVWLFRPLIMRQFAAERSTDAAIRTTVAATEMGGGVAPNVLPTRAWALINFRILPGESSETVRQRIRALVSDPRVEISIEGPRTDPSGVSDPSSAAFRTLQTAITGVFSDVLVVPGLSMVTTDSRHYARIADQTFRFLPTRMNRKDLERVHGTNERIAKHNYVEMVQFFIELMGHAGERG